MSVEATRRQTERAVQRVDRVLSACRRRDLDPLKVLARAVKDYDKQQESKP